MPRDRRKALIRRGLKKSEKIPWARDFARHTDACLKIVQATLRRKAIWQHQETNNATDQIMASGVVEISVTVRIVEPI